MDPNKLRQLRAEVLKRADAIIAKAEEAERSLTDEELAEVNSIIAEADKREKEIEAIEALAKREMDKLVDDVKGDIPEGDGGFRSLGDFIRTALEKPGDPRLRELTVTGSPGALVPEEYAKEILQVSQQASIVESRATVLPAGEVPDATINLPAVDYSGNMYGGVEVAWIAEGGLKPETDLSLTEIILAPKEVAAHTVVTDKLLRNAPAAEVVLNQLLVKAMAAAKDNAYMNGAVGGPTGILGHGGTVVVPRDVAADISYGDICDIFAQFLGESGVWVCANTALPTLMQMEDTGGHLIWQANAAVGPTGTLLGDALLKSQRQPVLGTEGDIGLYDFSQYIVKEGFGLAIAKSEHVYFTRNKTVIKCFLLVDGSPWIAAPLTLEDGVTQASPFVVLGDVAS